MACFSFKDLGLCLIRRKMTLEDDTSASLQEPISGETAVINLHGGEVMEWRTSDYIDFLFRKPESSTATMPLHGGITLCFPELDPLVPINSASNRLWSIERDPPPSIARKILGREFMDLILKFSPEETPAWPHRCEYRLCVTLRASELQLISRITNTDDTEFSFNFAYSTYFSVSDVSNVRIEGLENLNYVDNLKRGILQAQGGRPVKFDKEVDRVYHAAPDFIDIKDEGMRRTFHLRKSLPDTVVWNPLHKIHEDYRRMVCVGAAAAEHPIRLEPGEQWTGLHKITVSPPPDECCNCLPWAWPRV